MLCGLSFLVGRYVQPAGKRGSEVSISALAHFRTGSVIHQRQVVASPARGALLPALHASDPHARGVRAGPIEPLDSAQLETFFVEGSGMMGVRPPLPPVQSGDDFYHVIPFQVRNP